MGMGEKISEQIERKRAATYALLDNWGGQLEGYAKDNAPWTDRTANARQGLHGGVEDNGDNLLLFLSHGVEYGIWLELAHNSNYAIIGPTIDAHITRIKQTVADLWGD